MKSTKRKSALSLAAILSFGIATQTLGDIKTAQNALVAKDYETAIKNAKVSAQQQPYDAALVMARALIDTGQPEQAAEFAQFAIELVPNSFAARVLYATALRHKTNYWPPKSNFVAQLMWPIPMQNALWRANLCVRWNGPKSGQPACP